MTPLTTNILQTYNIYKEFKVDQSIHTFKQDMSINIRILYLYEQNPLIE